MKLSAFALAFILSILVSCHSSAQHWPASTVGQWTFSNSADLTHATVGNDLVLNGTQTIVDGIIPGDGAVAIGAGSYYACQHGISANGGGTAVNEYSLLIDFKVPDVTSWHCFYQTDQNNSNDGEVFLGLTGNLGVAATGYSGLSVPLNTWHRLVISVDLGTSFKYYLDGHLILSGTSQAVDGRFSLDHPNVLFFADDDGEDNLIDISQIALFDTPLSESEVLELGGLVPSNIHPYLQSPSPTSMYISWNSYNTESTKVHYGTSMSFGNYRTGSYQDISNNRWHTVKLTSLQPNTHYYYQCISGDDTSAIYQFRTPAVPGTPGHHTRFAIISDSQDDVHQSNLTADSLLATFNRLYGTNWADSISMIIHTGDITQDGSSIGRYMNEYFNSFSRLSCSVPFMVSIGNHELESSYFYSFMKYEEFSDFPVGNALNEKYYSFYLGDCQFIMMNTNGSYNNATQTNWLHEKLQASASNAQCDFVFEMNHQPGHSEIWPDGNADYVQNSIYGELAGFPKVTLSSHGHSHNYERGTFQSAHPGRQDFRIEIAGGAGGPLDRWGAYSNQTDYPEVQRSLDHYCYILVDVDQDNKTCNAQMYSLGNPDLSIPNKVMDSWHRRINQPAPQKPVALSPVSASLLTATLVASPFIGSDSLMSSRFQLVESNGDWDQPMLDEIRDVEDTYNVSGPPLYTPVNQNAGIDLTRYQVDPGLLSLNSTYKWRICYRDQNARWSEWSDPAEFTTQSSFPNTAEFASDLTTGTAPCNIHFVDLSLSNPTAWDWDLDGDTVIDSHAQDPLFTYTIPGNYNVTLHTHFGPEEQVITKTSYIQVFDPLGEKEAPEVLKLSVSPNPFRQILTVDFTINTSNHYVLQLVNLDGIVMNTLLDQNYQPGNYHLTWNPEDHNSVIEPGIYLLRLISNKSLIIAKLICLK